jgi:hypothetical protein
MKVNTKEAIDKYDAANWLVDKSGSKKVSLIAILNLLDQNTPESTGL